MVSGQDNDRVQKLSVPSSPLQSECGCGVQCYIAPKLMNMPCDVKALKERVNLNGAI